MKSKIPKFKSLAEERQFWQTHDTTEFWDELTPVKLTFAKPRKKSVSVRPSGFEVRILQEVLARLTGTRSGSHHASSHK